MLLLPTPQRRSAFLKIGAIVLCAIVAALALALLHSRRFIAEHIDEYRCRPLLMPVIDWIDDSIDPRENYRLCMLRRGDAFFEHVSGPLREATAQMVETANAGGDAAEQLLRGTSQIGETAHAQVAKAADDTGQLQTVTHFALLKMQGFFDKLGALVQNIYFVLLSIMDTANIVLALPEIAMKVLTFLVLVFGIVISILIVIFTITYLISTGQISLGTSLIAFLPTIPVGTTLVSTGSYIMSFIAFGIYMASVLMSTALLGVLMGVFIPLKYMFDTANRASYCCFSGDTPVWTRRTKGYTAMNRVQVGDVLCDGAIVLGVLKCREPAPPTPGVAGETVDTEWIEVNFSTDRIYKSSMRSTAVTAAHLVYPAAGPPGSGSPLPVPCSALSDTEWARMGMYRDESVTANRAGKRRANRHGRVCLVTSSRHIYTPHGCFMDYQEHAVGSKEMLSEASAALNSANAATPAEAAATPARLIAELEFGEEALGFSLATPVWLDGGKTSKALCHLRVGDRLFGGCEVIGTFTSIGSATNLLRCRVAAPDDEGSTEKFIVPPHQIIFCKDIGKWEKAYNLAKPELVTAEIPGSAAECCCTEHVLLLHLVTSTGWVPLAPDRPDENCNSCLFVADIVSQSFSSLPL